MQRINLAALMAASILTAAPMTAVADGNFYLAGSLGAASLDDNFDGFSINTNSTAFRLLGGWQFNPYFSIEGGYHNFGQFEQRFSNIGMPINIGIKADGFTLGLTGTIPMGEKFGLFGRAGSFFWDGDAEINNVSQARPEDTNFYFGAGGRYRFTEHTSLLLDWSLYQLDDTQSDVLSLGVIVDF